MNQRKICDPFSLRILNIGDLLGLGHSPVLAGMSPTKTHIVDFVRQEEHSRLIFPTRSPPTPMFQSSRVRAGCDGARFAVGRDILSCLMADVGGKTRDHVVSHPLRSS